RALSRGDYAAASSLLERALELTRRARLDVVLEVDLVDAVGHGERQRAAEIADSVADRARDAGDTAGEALARAAAAFQRSWFVPDPDIDELDKLARRALALLEERGTPRLLSTSGGFSASESRTSAASGTTGPTRADKLSGMPARHMRCADSASTSQLRRAQCRRTTHSRSSRRSFPKTRIRAGRWSAPGCLPC